MKGFNKLGDHTSTNVWDPPREMVIARLAERQHGVVSLSQLLLCGLTRSAIAKRAREGRLTRIHRGVYAVGHGRLTLRGHWMAAVLAYGPNAVLSHRSAAALHGIRPDNRRKTDVTVPSPSAKSRPRIDVHRSTTLQAEDITTIDGIPCTSLARTLLDLAEVLDRRGVERAVDQAEVRRVFDLRAVREVLARAAGRRGVPVLEQVLAEYDGPTLTEEELEERFFMLCREAGVPKPSVNVWMTLDDGVAYKADFMWRAERLIVETDGWGSHGTRQAFEHDRRRDRLLTLAGWEVVRFTWRDVEREPDEVRATLAGLWEARSGTVLADAS
jgi:predicted transcriptional regulator of viral defense system